jgi:hypothetical protein
MEPNVNILNPPITENYDHKTFRSKDEQEIENTVK